MQGASLLNDKLWYFADGPEQRARDTSMKADTEGRGCDWGHELAEQPSYSILGV